jgi:NAD(P)-dependent dehydrogenase (short-subunit alcohol dehydrogenase family)
MESIKEAAWLITGASSGFGLMLAERVLEHGGRVVALARNVAPLGDLERRHPGRLLCLAVDVRDHGAIDAGVATAVAAFGSVDVLVNNAGRGLFSALEEVSETALRDLFETNVFGVVRLVRATLPHLRRSARGRVIQISSAVGHATMPMGGLYAATKHAVEALSESLAGELAGTGVRVVIVEPGYFATNFAASMQFSAPLSPYDEVRKAVLAQFNSMPAGDPRLVVQRILDVVAAEDPPLRTAVGEDATHWILGSLEQRMAQVRLSHFPTMEAQ